LEQNEKEDQPLCPISSENLSQNNKEIFVKDMFNDKNGTYITLSVHNEKLTISLETGLLLFPNVIEEFVCRKE
jgi:hypothetical protein